MVNPICGNSKSAFIRCGASGGEKEKERPSVLARMVQSPYATAWLSKLLLKSGRGVNHDWIQQSDS